MLLFCQTFLSFFVLGTAHEKVTAKQAATFKPYSFISLKTFNPYQSISNFCFEKKQKETVWH